MSKHIEQFAARQSRARTDSLRVSRIQCEKQGENIWHIQTNNGTIFFERSVAFFGLSVVLTGDAAGAVLAFNLNFSEASQRSHRDDLLG